MGRFSINISNGNKLRILKRFVLSNKDISRVATLLHSKPVKKLSIPISEKINKVEPIDQNSVNHNDSENLALNYASKIKKNLKPHGDQIVTLGALFHLTGLCMPDILYLRLMGICSSMCSITFTLTRDNPFLVSAMWSSVFMAVNILMVTKLIYDRQDVKFPEDDMRIYETWFLPYGLTPRQFYKIMRMSTIKEISAGDPIFEEASIKRTAESVNDIVLVLSGDVQINHYSMDEQNTKPPSFLVGGSPGAILGAKTFLEATRSANHGKLTSNITSGTNTNQNTISSLNVLPETNFETSEFPISEIASDPEIPLNDEINHFPPLNTPLIFSSDKQMNLEIHSSSIKGNHSKGGMEIKGNGPPQAQTLQDNEKLTQHNTSGISQNHQNFAKFSTNRNDQQSVNMKNKNISSVDENNKACDCGATTNLNGVCESVAMSCPTTVSTPSPVATTNFEDALIITSGASTNLFPPSNSQQKTSPSVSLVVPLAENFVNAVRRKTGQEKLFFIDRDDVADQVRESLRLADDHADPFYLFESGRAVSIEGDGWIHLEATQKEFRDEKKDIGATPSSSTSPGISIKQGATVNKDTSQFDRGYKTVFAATNVRILVIPGANVRDWAEGDILFALPFTRSLSSALIARVRSLSAANVRDTYFHMLRTCVQDGIVGATEREALRVFRERSGISPEIHEECLETFGWKKSDFERGCLSDTGPASENNPWWVNMFPKLSQLQKAVQNGNVKAATGVGK